LLSFPILNKNSTTVWYWSRNDLNITVSMALQLWLTSSNIKSIVGLPRLSSFRMLLLCSKFNTEVNFLHCWCNCDDETIFLDPAVHSQNWGSQSIFCSTDLHFTTTLLFHINWLKISVVVTRLQQCNLPCLQYSAVIELYGKSVWMSPLNMRC